MYAVIGIISRRINHLHIKNIGIPKTNFETQYYLLATVLIFKVVMISWSKGEIVSRRKQKISIKSIILSN